MSSVVGTHADHGTIDLLQNVGDADHQVIFVGNQQLGSFDKTVLLVFLDFGFIRGIDKLFLRQLLDGENRERVDDQTDNGIDDSHGAPCFGSVAQCRDSQQCERLNGKAGGECEHEAVGTHLDSLGAVLGDKGSQGRVGDVVGRVEHSVQQGITDKEPCVLGKLAHAHGDGEDADQCDGAADVAVEHPRASLAQLGVRLVDHRAKEDVGNAVKQLGHSNQRADDAGIQADGVGQVNHNKRGEERIDHVARNIAGAVTDLVIPLQITSFSVFRHENFSILLCRGYAFSGIRRMLKSKEASSRRYCSARRGPQLAEPMPFCA